MNLLQESEFFAIRHTPLPVSPDSVSDGLEGRVPAEPLVSVRTVHAANQQTHGPLGLLDIERRGVGNCKDLVDCTAPGTDVNVNLLALSEAARSIMYFTLAH